MYRKLTYWLEKERYAEVTGILSGHGEEVRETRRAVCAPLSRKIRIGAVAPKAWSAFDTCRRQLSWYGASAFSGLYLLVSDVPLTDFGLDDPLNTEIRESDHRVGPTSGETFRRRFEALGRKASYRDACPAEFRDIDALEPTAQERWLKVMGIRGLSYRELFTWHEANHANFFEPEFWVDGKDGPEPCSIAGTSRVCSACLELFHIIGGGFSVKHVVPCPGAVLFAGMAVNRCYRVTSGLSENAV
jgi:hypothetical protein